MLGWAIGFFIAAAIAAGISYGVVQTDHADIARDVFWACIALFGASLLFAILGGRFAEPFRASGRAFARLAFVAAAALGVYVWIDRNWTAGVSDNAQIAANAGATRMTVEAAAPSASGDSAPVEGAAATAVETGAEPEPVPE